MRGLFAPPPRRVTEATHKQVIATGAGVGYGGYRDPVDGDLNWRRSGTVRREVPAWTREQAITYSVAAYRLNPMARAIVDTYTAFSVGDSGVTWQCTNPDVSRVVDEFWADPRNNLGSSQEIDLRSMLLTGEGLYEVMVGEQSGVVRYNPIDPASVTDVVLLRGNPKWPSKVELGPAGGGERRELDVVAVNDETGLREGQVLFWRPFRTLNTDVRSQPFLSPVLDWLDNYDIILSNLMDRTQLARYFVWDVTVEGGDAEVKEFVRQRGGLHPPASAGVEVHNQAVKWEAKSVSTNAEEDSVAAKAALTLVAGGTGLARTWLADPEDANRATSLTMAEPVRRRVGGVQRVWLGYQTEFARFAVDRAVAARRLAGQVESRDARTGDTTTGPASQTVTVTGPEIAAADATITAQILLNLSTGVNGLVESQLLSREAAKVLVRKAWEGFAGVPYRAELDGPGVDRDDVATAVDDAKPAGTPLLRLAQ